MKKSRFKIWLRAFLFLQFSAIFGFYFFRDIANGHFRWQNSSGCMCSSFWQGLPSVCGASEQLSS